MRARYYLPAAALSAIAVIPPRPAPAHSAPLGPLVTTAWLGEHLKDRDLVLLHVGDRAEYDKEHLPGARFVSLRDIAQRTPDGLTLEMLPPDTLRRRLEALGVSDASKVVVYFGNDWVTPATRVLFTLDWAGLGDHSALLDGGMPAWKAEGRAVTAEAPATRAGTLSSLEVRPSLVVDNAWVRAHLKSTGVRVVDARAAMFYSGPRHGEHRAGHVPGAVNVPFTEVAGDDLRFKNRETLAALFRDAGVAPGDTIVAYCHIGQQGTAVVLAARLLGRPVKLYDGSFEDWSRRAELPVEGAREASK